MAYQSEEMDIKTSLVRQLIKQKTLSLVKYTKTPNDIAQCLQMAQLRP